LITRPHTIMELEGGIIALPGAPISNAQRGGDTPIGRVGRGDATMQTGAHVLYRFNKNYVVGAGVIFSPFGTSDDQYGGGSHLARTHTRSYLFLGAEGRYVPLRYKSFEGWFGVSGGGVIVADRFHTDAPVVPPILGVPDVTIRTEGFAVGLQVGATYYISENWIAGANLRGYHWILPEGRQCSPIGDCATLAGSLQVFELGLTIGYRLPL
jgi:opacity protein-like surface antigen